MDLDPLELNRRNWDDRARVHGQDRLYDSEALVSGASSLAAAELDGLRRAVGSVAKLSVIHLQCHIGFDSISLARMGARVTGLDFSTVSLAKAASLAQRSGVDLSLVEADVCAPPPSLFGQFDLAYATIGVLCWIVDVGAWMRAVRRLLRPGGTLLLVEIHPFPGMVATIDPLRLDFPYLFDGPHHFDAPGSYTDRDAPIVATATVQYAHGLGEVVTAAVGAGLQVRWLEERTESTRDWRGDLNGPDADGRYRLRLGGQPMPMEYTLIADRPGSAGLPAPPPAARS
ncbi:MAG: class I SAM-dependent methyltransferase [Candidatus Dormibacteria bacterium]